ncbi:hypothetical protein IWX90DRAFT_95608 [Phyllosticta citrichinensis]|uniref:Cytochrome b561 domain-containing protein n=1 Tax=Phyllosticta citrichinensis TaxID=1130410 RepID=A0ABR1XEZ5_9PEZI
MWSNIAAIGLAGLASTAYAQISNNCAGDTCYGLNIPEATVNSGNGDIFLSMSGPTTYSYIALGQGSSMSGSRIFIMYTSANGQNVTVSPRLSSGHSEPEYDSSTEITILENTGVSGNTMTAYFKVSNAGTWNGGSMDFKSSSAQWIHAALAGSSLNTDDLNADISKHADNYGSFTWDFSQAKGGSSANPFTAAGATTSNSCPTNSGSSSGSGSSNSGSGSGSGGPGSGSSPAGFPSSFPSGSPFSGSGFGGFGGFNRAEDNCANANGANQLGQGFQAEIQRMRRIQTAHGVVACLAWAVFFPAGAISIRVFSFPGLVWFHAAWQIFSYGLYVAGFGLGVYLATNDNYMKEYHPIIGVVLFVFLFFQPIFGWLHHVLFKKYGGRTFWSQLHIWLGRILITLGVINGGLGLKLAGNTQKRYTVTYGVIAGTIWVVYMIAAVFGEVKRMRKPARGMPPNYAEDDPHHKENGNGHREVNGDYYGAYNPKPTG